MKFTGWGVGQWLHFFDLIVVDKINDDERHY